MVLYGSEGTDLAVSKDLAQACANLLIATGHVGKANNGLISVWSAVVWAMANLAQTRAIREAPRMIPRKTFRGTIIVLPPSWK